MIDKIDFLVLGESSYNRNENYGPYTVKNYPFPTVAFLPRRENNKEFSFYSILSYRRVMGFLTNRKLNEKDFKPYENSDEIFKELCSQNICLGNIDEFTDEVKKQVLNLLSNNATIIAFGSKAISCIEREFSIKNNYTFIKFPHPSQKVNHRYWKKFQNEYKERPYTLPSTIKKIFMT